MFCSTLFLLYPFGCRKPEEDSSRDPLTSDQIHVDQVRLDVALLLRLGFKALQNQSRRPVRCKRPRARAARVAERRYLHLGLLDGFLPYLLVVGPDLQGEEAECPAGPAPARPAQHSPSSGTRRWHLCRERPWGAPGGSGGIGGTGGDRAARPRYRPGRCYPGDRRERGARLAPPAPPAPRRQR